MLKRTLVFLSVFFISVISIEAQSVKGSVTDQDSSVIESATVILESLSGKAVGKTTTDQTGAFVIENVSEGRYRLIIEAKGFSRWNSEIKIDAGANIKIQLQPQNIAEVVSVSSNYLAGTPESLETTAGSFQSILKKELDQSRVLNFEEALRKVSGVSVRSEEGFGLRPNISIRGSDPTRSRKVLLLEDGVPLSYAPYGDNSSYYHPPIERFVAVEILKGSGQISYGPVTVAGVVNYLTPNPPAKPEFNLKIAGGDRDFFNGSAGFGGTFGNTGLIFNYTRKQGEGSRENIRAGVNDFSAKAVHTLNAYNVFSFKYSHFDESSRVTYSGLTEAEFAENPRQNPFRNDDLEFFREGYSLAHTGVLSPAATITTSFYTSYFSRDWWRQSSNSSQRPNRLNVDPDCLSMADLNTTCGNEGTPRDFRTIGIEPKLSYSFNTLGFRNFLTAGFRVHYETQNRRAYRGQNPNSREEGSEITESNLRNSLAVSSFVQNRFILGNFSVTPGVRIEKVRYQRSNLLNGLSAETELTQLIPGIGIAYNVFSKATVFAGVHRGFAPPSTSDILTNAGGVVELKSELSWNYEAGIRARPSEFLSFEATFFRNDYENQVIPASVAGGTGSTSTNAGSTLQQGFELNGRIDSNRIFKTDYNVYFQTAYTNVGTAEFRDNRFSGVSGFETVLVSGNRLPYVPKNLVTSSIGFEYRGFSSQLENNLISGQFTDDLNSTSTIANGQRGYIGSQSYLNATVNYRIEKLKSSIFVTVKNLADRLFIVDRTRGIYPGSPRTIQTGFTISF